MTDPSNPDKPDSRKTKLHWSKDVWDASRDQQFVDRFALKFTINLRNDLHKRLKLRAAQEGTTMGKLIEAWIESWDLDK